MRIARHALLVLGLLICGLAHAQFDHGYADWDALLKKHVHWLPDRNQSRIDYAAFTRDWGMLKRVRDARSAVPRTGFDLWAREQRWCFSSTPTTPSLSS